jgi:hypothetical protein
MNAAQKEAWFHLTVVVVASAVVAALTPFWGFRALSGWGLLGLIGFSPLFYRKKPGQVVADERDASIRRRSAAIGFGAIWCLFVAEGVAASLIYGENGFVPVRVVEVSLWGAFALLYGLMSAATLIQYRRG